MKLTILPAFLGVVLLFLLGSAVDALATSDQNQQQQNQLLRASHHDDIRDIDGESLLKVHRSLGGKKSSRKSGKKGGGKKGGKKGGKGAGGKGAGGKGGKKQVSIKFKPCWNIVTISARRMSS